MRNNWLGFLMGAQWNTDHALRNQGRWWLLLCWLLLLATWVPNAYFIYKTGVLYGWWN